MEGGSVALSVHINTYYRLFTRCFDQKVRDESITSRSANRLLIDSDVGYNTGKTGAAVVRLLASHQGEPGSVHGGVTPTFPHVGIVTDDAAGQRVFPGDLPFPPPMHSGNASESPAQALDIEVLRADVDDERRRNARAWGKRGITEKTRRPAASPGTILTRDNPGGDPAGIRTRFTFAGVRHITSSKSSPHRQLQLRYSDVGSDETKSNKNPTDMLAHYSAGHLGKAIAREAATVSCVTRASKSPREYSPWREPCRSRVEGDATVASPPPPSAYIATQCEETDGHFLTDMLANRAVVISHLDSPAPLYHSAGPPPPPKDFLGRKI
ncbi:hypothetical protein PR048_004163 [Dryococelus australis]|uniref:Uncharacterized protein n=1 Tax=Dryococelus australis TaxID=614101 RepID=A0ABQ9I4U3_9NEOP|nr:hypothetical protein PR048_004163 [Dryococelus australis]